MRNKAFGSFNLTPQGILLGIMIGIALTLNFQPAVMLLPEAGVRKKMEQLTVQGSNDSVIATTEDEVHKKPHQCWIIEAGVNKPGGWLRAMAEERTECNVLFFEPNPRFLSACQNAEREWAAMNPKRTVKFYHNAVWKKKGEVLSFHAHEGEGGIGSSLVSGSVYQHEGGAQVINVTTVDMVDVFGHHGVRPEDEIHMRLDIEGAEYEVMRRIITAGMACWFNVLHFEGHAMYSEANFRMRMFDAVLPWLLRACHVQVEVECYYPLNTGQGDPRVQKLKKEKDNPNCMMCPMLYEPIPESH